MDDKLKGIGEGFLRATPYRKSKGVSEGFLRVRPYHEPKGVGGGYLTITHNKDVSSFITVARHDKEELESTMTISSQAALRGDIPVRRIKEVPSFITVARHDSGEFDSTMTISSQAVLRGDIPIRRVRDLESSITVAVNVDSLIDSTMAISSQAVLRAEQHIFNPPIHTEKVSIEKDTTNIENAPVINYGESHQLLVGKDEDGECNSIIGFPLEKFTGGDYEIMSIELVFNKFYETEEDRLGTLVEVRDHTWDEYYTTWYYKPKEFRDIQTFKIPKEKGPFSIDMTNYPFRVGRYYSFYLKSEDGLNILGSRESYAPPYLKIRYRNLYPNVGAKEAGATLYVNEFGTDDLDSTIDVNTNFLIDDIPSSLEIKQYDKVSRLDSSIEVARHRLADIDGKLRIVAKEDTKLKDGTIVVPYRKLINGRIEIFHTDADTDLDSEMTVKRDHEVELDSAIEVKEKHVFDELPSSITIKEDKIDDLISVLELIDKEGVGDLDSEVTVKAYGIDDLESFIELLRYDEDKDIETTAFIRAAGHKDVDSYVELKRYLVERDEEAVIRIAYRVFMDATVEIIEKQAEDLLESEITVPAVHQYEHMRAEMYVRAFWVEQLDSYMTVANYIDLVSGFDIEEKEGIQELGSMMKIPGAVGDYAFII